MFSDICLLIRSNFTCQSIMSHTEYQRKKKSTQGYICPAWLMLKCINAYVVFEGHTLSQSFSAHQHLTCTPSIIPPVSNHNSSHRAITLQIQEQVPGRVEASRDSGVGIVLCFQLCFGRRYKKASDFYKRRIKYLQQVQGQKLAPVKCQVK